jgi:2-oxoglutarate ferredoxin oxidoreductase subunit alpha
MQRSRPVRIALEYRTPVMLLSDGYLANGTEPWKLPDIDSFPSIDIEFASELNGVDSEGREVFWPYVRNDDLARPWAIPGTEALMHRIGGIEKQDGTGNISYDPTNHEFMVVFEKSGILKIADKLPPLEVMG